MVTKSNNSPMTSDMNKNSVFAVRIEIVVLMKCRCLKVQSRFVLPRILWRHLWSPKSNYWSGQTRLTLLSSIDADDFAHSSKHPLIHDSWRCSFCAVPIQCLSLLSTKRGDWVHVRPQSDRISLLSLCLQISVISPEADVCKLSSS